MLDYHVILDLLPTVALLYFEKRLGDEIRLSAVQSSILLALGLQRKTIEEIETELQLPVSQALALFVKVMRKINKKLVDVQKAAISAQMPEPTISRITGDNDISTKSWEPVAISLEDELTEAGREVTSELKEKQREMIDALDLKKYAIDDASGDWSIAETQAAGLVRGSGKATVISVKGTAVGGQKRKAEDGDVKDLKEKKTRRGKKAKR